MLIILYGQQKSASTYLAQIARAACAIRGGNQMALRKRLLTGPWERNRTFWRDDLTRIGELADQVGPNGAMSIKTHSGYLPAYDALFARPDIRLFMSYRHPGDAALSAWEAGTRARAEGDPNKPFFSNLLTHRAAIDWMAGVVQMVTIPWLRSRLGQAFSYEVLTSDTAAVLAALAEALDLDPAALAADPEVAALVAGNARPYNFNQGVAGRHREVFDAADLAHLEARCGRFIAFCQGEIAVSDL